MGDCNNPVAGDPLTQTNLEQQYSADFDSFSSSDTDNVILSNGTSGNNVSVYKRYLQSSFNQLLSFYTSATPPSAADSTRTALETKNKKFINHISKEYKFYLCRYNRVLTEYTNVFNSTGTLPTQQFGYTAASGSTSVKTNTLNTIATRASQINTKLIRLSALLQKIAASSLTLLQTASSSQTAGTAALETAIRNLNSSKPTVDAVAQLEAQRRALEDTRDKNRYSNMYLGIYAFLNITALAVILHIATSE
jgi:hypothetical protein